MSDFLSECNSGKLRTKDIQGFQQTWCVRCSRPECDLAQFALTDPMARRQATWRERYFGLPQADIHIPKFAQIAGLDFPDLLQKAVKLEISARRGDWSVPEINISDGLIVPASPASANQVEEAVRQLRRPVGNDPAWEEDGSVENGDLLPDENEPPEEEIEDLQGFEAPSEEPGEPPVAPPSKKQIVQPRGGNTPDQGEIMLGGGPAPSSRPRPAAESDPWAPPPRSNVKVVEVGATITLGGRRDD
jgi:hypothetical protein